MSRATTRRLVVTSAAATDLTAAHDGYDVDLTDPAVTVREHPVLTEYEQRHIAPNMGPQQLRGVWYPQHNLGDSAGSASRHRD